MELIISTYSSPLDSNVFNHYSSQPKQMFSKRLFSKSDLNFKASLTEKKEYLEKLQQQNSRLEHEVKRYQEREKHLEKIRVLEKKRPWAVSIARKVLLTW